MKLARSLVWLLSVPYHVKWHRSLSGSSPYCTLWGQQTSRPSWTTRRTKIFFSIITWSLCSWCCQWFMQITSPRPFRFSLGSHEDTVAQFKSLLAGHNMGKQAVTLRFEAADVSPLLCEVLHELHRCNQWLLNVALPCQRLVCTLEIPNSIGRTSGVTTYTPDLKLSKE